MASASAAMLMACGVAPAVNKQCMTTNNNHTCFGTRRADTLLGTEKFESIHGRGSPDTIKSFAGGDAVDCGTGNDTVYFDSDDTVLDWEVRRDLQGNLQ